MQTLQDKDKRYIWHPYSSLVPAEDPIPIVKGEGAYLIDEAGNRYLDAISSWWVTIHGHAHPYIAQKIWEQAQQLEQVIFTRFTHRPAVELAEILINLLPAGFSKIFYSDNGSTCVEVAVKMALQYWWNKQPAGHPAPERTKILAFSKGYHGDTFGAMSLSDRSIFTAAFRDKLFDVVFLDTPDSGNIDRLKQEIAGHAPQTAAFLYEPLLQGAGGMLMYDGALLNQLLLTCRRHDIICIADEVLTGFGRTGHLFASDTLKTKPDLICLSKGLTGGTLPLGVTACNTRITEAFNTPEKLKIFFHGHSFTANPLSCAAAIASFELFVMEESMKKVRSIGAAHLGFAERLRKFSNIKDVRCLGTIIAFEYISGTDGYLNNIAPLVTAFMLERNIYLRPLGNTLYIMPPYCTTVEELERIYSAIEEFLSDSNLQRS